MKLNLEQKAIMDASANGTLAKLAAEKVRRNESGWQQGWTIEQHIAYMEKKSAEWNAQLQEEIKPSFRPLRNIGTFRDADKALEQFGFGE